MITVRRSEERRHFRHGVRDTWMSFDPDNAVDPLRRGFHALRSLNEDNLGPELGLYPHPQEDLELITYVHEGSVIHQDSAGGLGRMGPGEFQRTSVSRGICHRALNGSMIDSAHVFQSGIDAGGIALRLHQEQKHFPVADREGLLRIIVSPAGERGSLSIPQDVLLFSSILLHGQHLIHELRSGRGAWLHVVKGRVQLRDHDLRAGDAAALEDEPAISFTARGPAEILLFDLA